MQRVFLSVIGDAIESTPQGGQLFVKTWAADDDVFVSVEDGCPCGAELRAENDGRSDPGALTGLGPKLIHSIVLAHGGRLSVRQEPGAGSRITFELPRWRGH